MGTGIVSVALAQDNEPIVSFALLGIAGISWSALAVVVFARLIADRPRLLAEARSPGGLTGLAATAVLGARLVELGWLLPAVLLLGLAVVTWPVLMLLAIHRLPRRASGDWFMLTVVPEGLAALAAALAPPLRVGWLAGCGFAFAASGLALYPVVLVRFQLRDIVTAQGEHWVTGGSLAISALAFAQIALADRHLGLAGAPAGVFGDAGVVLWGAAMLWLAALLIGELRRPRLQYDFRRWSTVFPVGMYAASGFAVASATRTPIIRDFARVWVGVAAAIWILVSIGMLRHGSTGSL